VKTQHLERASAGFTIIEVVLAMGLLLLGMTSVLGLLSFGAALTRTAALRTAAAAAAEAVVADLEDTLFPLEVDAVSGRRNVGEPHTLDNRPVPGHAGLVYSARATPVPASDDEVVTGSLSGDRRERSGPRRYKVEVRMSWTSSGRKRERSFTCMLLREVPFGERLRREFVERELDPLGARLAPPPKAAAPAKP
jgi:hypothetical protein